MLQLLFTDVEVEVWYGVYRPTPRGYLQVHLYNIGIEETHRSLRYANGLGSQQKALSLTDNDEGRGGRDVAGDEVAAVARSVRPVDAVDAQTVRVELRVLVVGNAERRRWNRRAIRRDTAVDLLGTAAAERVSSVRLPRERPNVQIVADAAVERHIASACHGPVRRRRRYDHCNARRGWKRTLKHTTCAR